MQTLKRSAALVLAALVTIAGCKGDDGKNGVNGTNGQDLRPELIAETCTYCHKSGAFADPTPFHDDASAIALAKGTVEILTANFTAAGAVVKPTITFQVRDGSGAFVDDWQAFNFTIAQLVAGTAAKPEHWEPYVWGTRTGYSHGIPSRENGGAATTGTPKGTLTFDAASHTYTYVFATDIAAAQATLNPADSTLAPVYSATATQRVGLQITTYAAPAVTPPFDMANGVADFVPSGGTAPVTPARAIATTDACNKCHGRLAIHGRRVEVAYCTTCHNAQLMDSNGLTGNLGPYVHKIHGREKLTDPTIAILGGVIPEEITYPQAISNCATCHTGAQANYWNTKPSRMACGSCHDALVFSTHMGGQADDANCAGCHTVTAITNAHLNVAEEEAKKLLPQIGTVAYSTSTRTLTVQFRIVNPLSADAPYALTNAYFTQTGGASSLTCLVALNNTDFTNAGLTGTTFGQPLNINLLSLPAGSTLSAQDASGYYTLTVANALPAGATGGGTVAIQGHPAFDHDANATTAALRIPMKNASKEFSISGALVARRSAVSMDKCNACHFNLSLHGSNRTGDITTCTMCHNTEATDGSRRPNFTTAGALGVDGKLEEGIDFKYMIHSIHGTGAGAAITVYGFGGSVNDFSTVKYPNKLANCQACHVATMYEGPAATANGTSTFAGADRASGADNLRTTKGLATCGVCHTTGQAQSHITQMGGARDVTQAQIDAVNQ